MRRARSHSSRASPAEARDRLRTVEPPAYPHTLVVHTQESPESTRPDTATWVAFAIALIVTLVAAFYRAGRFEDNSRAVAAGLAAPIVILIVWSVGFVRHVRRRRNWRRFMVFAGRAAVLITGWVLLGDWNRGQLGRPPSYPVTDLRTGAITYAQFLRVSRELAPAHFDANFKGGIVQTQLLGWRDTDPSALVRDVSLRITDDGEVFRGQVNYVVQVRVENTPHTFQARVVTLVHDGGVVTLESSCLEDCDRAEYLMVESEGRLLASLGSSALDGFLPDGGVCSEEQGTHPQTGTITPTLTCEYDDITLSLSRKSNRELQTDITAMLDRSEAR